MQKLAFITNFLSFCLFIGLLISKSIQIENIKVEKDKELLKKQIELDSLKTKLDFCNGVNY